MQSKRAWISGTVVATTSIVVLVVALGASVWFNLDRSRLAGRVDVLQSELEKTQSRIEELQNTVNAERLAREQAEMAADEAKTAAAEDRQRLKNQQQKADTRIQALQVGIREFEQRLAAANEARTKAETDLSNQIELRKRAEQTLADVMSEIQREQELVGQRPDRSGTPTEDTADADSRAAVEVTEREPEPSAVESDTAEQETEARVAATPVPEPTTEDESPATTPADTGTTYDTPPKPLELARPIYPFSLKREGVEGHVVVAFTVDTQGRVRNVEAVESTNRAFESAAVDAVRQWRFRPALRNGQPVELRLSQRLNFTTN